MVELSLADDQNFAFLRGRGNSVQATFEGTEHVTVAMRNLPYIEIYDHLAQARAFNAKMLDGALIQMMYEFKGGELQGHRLAYFPSPHLEEFQNSPEIYLDDEVYANVVAKNIVSIPMRFDFDAADSNHHEVAHPKSHLTLGQFKNCRIPVTAPLIPFHFIEFILRNFYDSGSSKFSERLPRARGGEFAESIVPSEKGVVHVAVPKEMSL